MSDLLPCPFCGGPAELRTSDRGYRHGVRVMCEPCGVDITHEGSDLDSFKLKAGAIAAWNRRADPPCTDCGGTGISYQTERVCACSLTDEERRAWQETREGMNK